MLLMLLRFMQILARCLWIASVISACDHSQAPQPKSQATIDVGAGPDLFREMDRGLALTADEIKGRNAWHLWTAGNDAFWDEMARQSGGLVDLLKTLDSRNRGFRFKKLGLINEPGYRQAKVADQFGLWLDEPISDSSPAVDPQIGTLGNYRLNRFIVGIRFYRL